MGKSASDTLFFYQGDKLVTVKRGDVSRTIFRTPDQPLAERQADAGTSTGLLVTDDKGSVLSVQEADEDEPHGYSAYGHDPGLPSSRTLLGFNGEALLALHSGYLLGNGYRSFNPALGRFMSPDSLCPFDQGGLNAYCYCAGDPINHTDPSGHLAPRAWRAPTTAQWRPIRALELEGHGAGTTAVTNRREVRALENMANSVLQDEYREQRRNLRPGPGNLHLASYPSRANPDPQRHLASADSGPASMDSAGQSRPVAMPTEGTNQRSNEPAQTPQAPRRRSASNSSTDSWDEWRPNLEIIQRQRDERIADAIRRARHGE